MQLVEHDRYSNERNRALLGRTKREMIRRHHRQMAKEARKKARERAGRAASSSSGADGENGLPGSDPESGDADLDNKADELAAKLAGDLDDDPNAERVELLREDRPQAGVAGEAGVDSAEWARRSAEERLSAAGAAPQASDRSLGAGIAGQDGDTTRDQRFGVPFNPKDYPWTEDPCNVHWS